MLGRCYLHGEPQSGGLLVQQLLLAVLQVALQLGDVLVELLLLSGQLLLQLAVIFVFADRHLALVLCRSWVHVFSIKRRFV